MKSQCLYIDRFEWNNCSRECSKVTLIRRTLFLLSYIISDSHPNLHDRVTQIIKIFVFFLNYRFPTLHSSYLKVSTIIDSNENFRNSFENRKKTVHSTKGWFSNHKALVWKAFNVTVLMHVNSKHTLKTRNIQEERSPDMKIMFIWASKTLYTVGIWTKNNALYTFGKQIQKLQI